MNLKQLHDDVAAILDPCEAFCLKLEIWNHRRVDGPEVTVSIWTPTIHHCEGSTPEAALAVLRERLGYAAPVVSIADVTLPTKPEVERHVPRLQESGWPDSAANTSLGGLHDPMGNF